MALNQPDLPPAGDLADSSPHEVQVQTLPGPDLDMSTDARLARAIQSWGQPFAWQVQVDELLHNENVITKKLFILASKEAAVHAANALLREGKREVLWKAMFFALRAVKVMSLVAVTRRFFVISDFIEGRLTRHDPTYVPPETLPSKVGKALCNGSDKVGKFVLPIVGVWILGRKLFRHLRRAVQDEARFKQASGADTPTPPAGSADAASAGGHEPATSTMH